MTMRKPPKDNSADLPSSSATPEASRTGGALTGSSVPWVAIPPNDVVLGSSPKATLLLTAVKFLAEYLETEEAKQDRPTLNLSRLALQRNEAEASLVLDDPGDLMLYRSFVARMGLVLGLPDKDLVA